MNGLAFQPTNPGFANRCRRSFEAQKFMDHIGATMPVIEPGYCEVHLPVREEMTQQHGYVHGGAMAAIADSAAGYAAFSLFDANSAPLTVEYKLNILRPGEGERMVARAQVVKPGRTLTVVQSDVFAIVGDRESLCVTSLQTLMRLEGMEDAA
jgi:uncharacterized protein (TIGR00369 family)